MTDDVDALASAAARLSAELLQRGPDPTHPPADCYEPAVNVVGVAVGERVVAGRATGTPAIRLLVRSKAGPGDLPRDHELPRAWDGFPTDVVEVGTLHALHAGPGRSTVPGQPEARAHAVRADARAPLGTAGALVHSGSQRLVLTTRGVLAAGGSCATGSPVEVCQEGGTWIQAGAVSRALPFGPQTSVDGAVLAIDERLLDREWVRHLERPHSSGPAEVGAVVHKVGVATGYTTGLVVAVNADVVVCYDDGPHLLAGQVLVRSLDDGPFALPGDSGALLVEQRTGLAVAMIVAGSDRVCVANHLDDVLDGLGVALGPPPVGNPSPCPEAPPDRHPAGVPVSRPFRPRLPVVRGVGRPVQEVEHRPCRSTRPAGRRLAPWEAARAARPRRTPQPRMPTASYFLCCLPRSGSWLLADGLKATGVAGLPEEYYWDDFYQDYLDQWERPELDSYADFLTLSQRFGSTDNGVFGAKIHWGELVQLDRRMRTLPGTAAQSTYQLLARFFPNPRFVYLRRQDKVRQAISWFRAAGTAGWYSVAGESTGTSRDIAPSWQRIRLLERALRADEQSWERFFALARTEPLRITYEDLSSRYEQGITETLRYLHLTPATPVAARPPRLSVQRDASTEEWVQTYLTERRRLPEV